MEREIINSEMIKSFGYDVENGILEIEFRKGGAVWQQESAKRIYILNKGH